MGRAFLIFSLYFQNIKMAGVNRQSFQLYIPIAFRRLGSSRWFLPIDKKRDDSGSYHRRVVQVLISLLEGREHQRLKPGSSPALQRQG